MTRSAVIVDVVRSPVGARGGGLSTAHPADLAGQVVAGLVARSRVDPDRVDDVLVGCATPTGAQAGYLARAVVAAAGLARTVPASHVDGHGAASLQALLLAARGVVAGIHDVAVAAGVEVMSVVPGGAAHAGREHGTAYGPRVRHRYRTALGDTRLVPPGVAAEELAARHGVDRDACDELALRSHTRAALARAQRRTRRELVAVAPAGGGSVTRDEQVRRDVTLAALARLKPTFRADGVVTAGTTAAIGDGAAAALVVAEDAVRSLRLRARARLVAGVVVGGDAVALHDAVLDATDRVLARAGVDVADLDVVEVAEHYASVVAAWCRTHVVDPERVNPNGGAIALGDPLGASGLRSLATLVSELERTKAKLGLVVCGAGGGQAVAVVVERLG